jgi:hypothetical protein
LNSWIAKQNLARIAWGPSLAPFFCASKAGATLRLAMIFNQRWLETARIATLLQQIAFGLF